jgi:hypothetical protein
MHKESLCHKNKNKIIMYFSKISKIFKKKLLPNLFPLLVGYLNNLVRVIFACLSLQGTNY